MFDCCAAVLAGVQASSSPRPLETFDRLSRFQAALRECGKFTLYNPSATCEDVDGCFAKAQYEHLTAERVFSMSSVSCFPSFDTRRGAPRKKLTYDKPGLTEDVGCWHGMLSRLLPCVHLGS